MKLSAGTSSFGAYYLGVILRPRQTFETLMADPRRLRFGTLALCGNAILYTLVYLFLIFGGGRPTAFKPWLAIPADSYYHYNVFFLAPSMFMSWILAAGSVQLCGRWLAGRGSFEDTLSSLGFGAAAASWWTLAHDLISSFLGAVHVIDQRAFEDALNGPTPWRTLLWILMAGYVVWFILLFVRGVGAAQRLRPGASALLGMVAFAVYQLTFVLFNR